MKPPTKLLLALQFWERDRAQAMKVARLITDMNPGFSDQADFLFAARFDCTQDLKTVEYVSRKFNVHHFINYKFRGAEFPFGCNSLWFGTMDHVFTMSEAKRIPEYKAMLTFEADSCPIHPAWISQLSQAWDRLGDRVKVAGHFLPNGPDGKGHINGNCLFSTDLGFLRWITRDIGGCNPQMGWDYVLAPKFREKGWKDLSEIRSWYQTPTATPEMFQQLLNSNVSLLHGVKDESLLQLVRARFCP